MHKWRQETDAFLSTNSKMPANVPAGSGVWLTAFWFNDKMEAGPAATAKQVYIGESLALAA